MIALRPHVGVVEETRSLGSGHSDHWGLRSLHAPISPWGCLRTRKSGAPHLIEITLATITLRKLSIRAMVGDPELTAKSRHRRAIAGWQTLTSPKLRRARKSGHARIAGAQRPPIEPLDT